MIQFLIISLMILHTTNGDNKTVHDFSLTSITGETVELSDYKDNVILIVNTASECGYTVQYKGLQELYETYADENFVILGFPANNFGGQEPGQDEEILEFCERNYGVSFPLFSKISVKGSDQNPLFNFLTNAENPDFKGDINWNFEKFLIDKDGNLIRRFRSQTKPMSTELTSSIETLLEM